MTCMCVCLHVSHQTWSPFRLKRLRLTPILHDSISFKLFSVNVEKLNTNLNSNIVSLTFTTIHLPPRLCCCDKLVTCNTFTSLYLIVLNIGCLLLHQLLSQTAQNAGFSRRSMPHLHLSPAAVQTPTRPDTHHPLQDFSKDDVLAVQPAGHHGGDEELGSVGIFASVGHAEPAGAVVLQLEVLVGETVSVDALALFGKSKSIVCFFSLSWPRHWHCCCLQVSSYLQFHLLWWNLLPGSWTAEWLGGICFLCSQILSVQCEDTNGANELKMTAARRGTLR